ncbi:hypothetical protein CULC809_01878 [Corynebacterium ulcerans 809]|uniref:hypothetical protein n=1 Tax=Corynebacterium ulcerans TaxID=65058 RepID=UPI00021850AA|nr:hypothetical protein [Corynebacterium ulcerans]AEG82405.1 hypothetical protein CULC809_01878 [Corynebacterium ulcerans 809]
MSSAIYHSFDDLFTFDFLSSNPEGYYSDAWASFENILLHVKHLFLDIKDSFSS